MAEHQSGDRCPQPGCQGRLRVRTSRRICDSYERYLECNACQFDAGKVVVPAERVWQRTPSVSST